MRKLAVFFVFFLLVAGCTGLNKLGPSDYTGTPTVYARVQKEPNPTLMGYWRRIPPSEFAHADQFEYVLLKKGDKYAVYYYWRDGHNGNYFKGWVDATINGDSMQIGYDGTIITLKGDELYHKHPAHSGEVKMMKLD